MKKIDLVLAYSFMIGATGCLIAMFIVLTGLH